MKTFPAVIFSFAALIGCASKPQPPERVDQLLIRPQQLVPFTQASTAPAARANAAGPRGDYARARYRFAATYPVGRILIVRGRVIPASDETRQKGLGGYSVSDGSNEFAITSLVGREQLARNVGKDVELRGRVVGNTGVTQLAVDRLSIIG